MVVVVVVVAAVVVVGVSACVGGADGSPGMGKTAGPSGYFQPG
jgi:ABC-type methionine transport system permease subunit